MGLNEALRLIWRIQPLKAVFERTDVGGEVALTGFELRLFGGRWTPVFRRVR